MAFVQGLSAGCFATVILTTAICRYRAQGIAGWTPAKLALAGNTVAILEIDCYTTATAEIFHPILSENRHACSGRK